MLCQLHLVTRTDEAKHIHFCTGLGPYIKLCVLANELERIIAIMEQPIIFDADFRLITFGKAMYKRLLDCLAHVLVIMGGEQSCDVTTWSGFDKTYKTVQPQDVMKVFSRDLEYSDIIPCNITKKHLLDKLRATRSQFDFAMLTVEQKMLSRTITASGRYMMHLILELNHENCSGCVKNAGSQKDHTCLGGREEQAGKYLAEAIRAHNPQDLVNFITCAIDDLISHIPKRRVYLHIMKTCTFY